MLSANTSIAELLETYSRRHPQEVLLVNLQADDKIDEVMIFKGFSSSLMHPTAYDADVAVIPDHAEVLYISRLKAPYQPNAPQYLQEKISWAQFLELL
ncbi:MAG: hypothetical protein WCO45_07100 [Pseudanabaena sp. ELA607]|jgi:hypothetical protein